MSRISLLVYTLSFVVLLSCKKDPEITIDDQEATVIEAYLDSMGLSSDVGQDTSGLYFYPITINPSGKTQAEGNVLKFFYNMALLDGTVIDQYDSLDADTLVVQQGVNAIYPVGFDYSLAHLKEGEKWGFVLPSRIAFGDYSYSSLIPENAIIKLEIELLEIHSEDDVLDEELDLIYDYMINNDLRDTVNYPLNQPEFLNNGMLYKRLSTGGSLRPAADSTIGVRYVGYFMDGTVFDRETDLFEFIYGQQQTIPGFEIGIGQMAVQERALVIMPSYLAYRESAQVIPPFLTNEMVDLEIIPTYASKVGPYKPLIFEIQLIGVN
ncbi:MAG: hypothetical protein CMB80_33845 [Flammeovirgaceae bacterium]|nr:hypothetical protein [Flammeovirgaceae bacterium]MBE61535.1 hypothetical protein [Flammeovirgaceae bacterium]MBR08894.1 hypothetical protein [Rickettsiales bacterium]|tara:strand:- start:531 stop:1499 length:969 start_codon:yes stop_codon:yes gene_type:complete